MNSLDVLKRGQEGDDTEPDECKGAQEAFFRRIQYKKVE
jgi:hypothetical protein